MFYVVSIQNLGETTAQSIFAYEDRKEAFSAYHSTLASNYVSDAVKGFCTMVLNEHGGTEAREYYDKPVVVEEITEE